jgi:dienelactone hydrolase
LISYFARPDAGLSALASRERGDNAPYSAVVVLHGCSGISSHSAAIADRLGAWGYVALTVDTLGPRGIAGRCGGQIVDQAFDAYAALRYLSRLEFVDPPQIAVLGQSMGAAMPRFTPLLATWRRNTLPSGSAPPSPIIRTAASPMGPI